MRRSLRRASTVPRLDLGRVARSSLLLLRRRGALFVGAAALVFIPASFLDAAVDWLAVLERRSEGGGAYVGLVTATLLVLVLTNLGAVFYSGVVGDAVAAERRLGRRATLRATLVGLPYLRLLAVEAVYLDAVVAGTLLFVVPGLLAFLWFALAGSLVTLEDLGPRSALRRSFQLVRGNELRVLLVVGAAFVLEAAVGVLIGAVAPETGLAGGAAALLRNVLVAPFVGVATVVISLELTRAPV